MVSLGMLPPLASRMALRKRAFASGSPPPERAATVISLINFVNSLPRLASSAPFLCLILCHLECPDIGVRSFWNVTAIYHCRLPIAECQLKLIGNWQSAIGKELFQSLVFLPCLSQHRQVGVGVFPEREEILVSLACPSGVAGERGRTSEAEMREHVRRRKKIDSGTVYDRLELPGCLVTHALLQI